MNTPASNRSASPCSPIRDAFRHPPDAATADAPEPMSAALEDIAELGRSLERLLSRVPVGADEEPARIRLPRPRPGGAGPAPVAAAALLMEEFHRLLPTLPLCSALAQSAHGAKLSRHDRRQIACVVCGTCQRLLTGPDVRARTTRLRHDLELLQTVAVCPVCSVLSGASFRIGADGGLHVPVVQGGRRGWARVDGPPRGLGAWGRLISGLCARWRRPG